jgi:hypothetical protein
MKPNFETKAELRARIADLEKRLRIANEYIMSFRADVFAGRIGGAWNRKQAGVFAGFAPDRPIRFAPGELTPMQRAMFGNDPFGTK